MPKIKPLVWLIFIAIAKIPRPIGSGLFIVILGFALRVAFFGSLPPSPHWDEISLGYNAYSLLHTGRDEWGMALPIIFRAFGDYKLPVYAYLAVASQAVLGLNIFATRLPSLVAGMGLIIVAFALGRKAAGNLVGLFSALLVAVSPWTLFLSRIGSEANVCAFLIAAGMYFLFTGKFFRASLLLGLSIWTYNSARVFVPLFLVSYLVIFKYFKRLSTINYLLLAIFFIPMFIQILNPVGQARYQNLSLIDSGAIARISEWQTGKWGGRVLYNKATYFAANFVRNYISYLSPNFLFWNGGSHYQLSVPNTGLLYWINLPLFYFGIFLLVKYPSKFNRFLLLWLLLSPVAGSITRDSPHTTRAIVMLPLPMLISALGLNYLVTKFKWKTAVLAVFFISLYIGWEQYIIALRRYQTQYSWAWQYGYFQTVQYIKSQYDNYDRIIFTKRYGEPHAFVTYYWPWDPADFAKNKVWDYHDNWYWVNELAKIKFVNDWEIKDYVTNLPFDGKYLVVSSPDNESPGTEVLKINFLDNKPAFIIKKI